MHLMPQLPAGHAPHFSEIFRRKKSSFLGGFDIPTNGLTNGREFHVIYLTMLENHPYWCK